MDTGPPQNTAVESRIAPLGLLADRPGNFQGVQFKHHRQRPMRQASVAERSFELPPVNGEPTMPSLLFNCPKTNQQVPTGIDTDVQSLRASWKTTVKVNCPHCGEVHEMSVRETYLNGVLQPLGRAGPSSLGARRPLKPRAMSTRAT